MNMFMYRGQLVTPLVIDAGSDTMVVMCQNGLKMQVRKSEVEEVVDAEVISEEKIRNTAEDFVSDDD
jgi:hypothetical protein